MGSYSNEVKVTYANMSAEHVRVNRHVPIDMIVDEAIQKLQELRNGLSILFSDFPIDLESAAEHVQVARLIYRCAVDRVRRHHQDQEEGLMVNHLRHVSKLRGRCISLEVHIWAYDLVSCIRARKGLLARRRDSRLARLEEAMDKVVNHRRLITLDEGNIAYF